jgi:citrate lyase subunit beta / citryl-CoA lyase
MTQSPIRSYLYVPGNNPRMLEKALHTEADALILDLEDAIAPGRKDEARTQVAAALQSHSDSEKPLFVRINAYSTGLAQRDIEAVATPALAGLRVPKAESPDEIRQIAQLLEQLGSTATIQCIIESALGIERAFALASAHPTVTRLGLGEADLAADLGVSDDAGFAYARSRVVVAARAARLSPPVQSVYTHIYDLEELKRTTQLGKHMGFFGRTALHPSQIAIINDVFTPTEAEIAAAQSLIDRLNHAVKLGAGAFALEDGRFVDLAVVESARRVLALAHYR